MQMEWMISLSIAIPDFTTPSLDSGLLQNKIFIHIDCMIDKLLFWKINIGFKYNKLHINVMAFMVAQVNAVLFIH